MTKKEFDRIQTEIKEFGDYIVNINHIMKYKELEVLEQIANSLKSISDYTKMLEQDLKTE